MLIAQVDVERYIKIFLTLGAIQPMLISMRPTMPRVIANHGLPFVAYFHF
jgi:hypothetical protein